jgi:hypothetical protein
LAPGNVAAAVAAPQDHPLEESDDEADSDEASEPSEDGMPLDHPHLLDEESEEELSDMERDDDETRILQEHRWIATNGMEE